MSKVSRKIGLLRSVVGTDALRIMGIRTYWDETDCLCT